MSDDIPTRREAKKRAHPNARGPEWTAQQVDLQKKRDEALKLRLAGLSYPAIAKQMNLSTAMVAWRYVNNAVHAIPAENAQQLKKLERSKLDAREVAIAKQLQREGLTIDQFVKLQALGLKNQERRARLEGLDAPAKLEHTFADQVNANTVREMTDEQLRRIAAGDFSVLSGATRGDGASASGVGTPTPDGTPGANGSAH